MPETLTKDRVIEAATAGLVRIRSDAPRVHGLTNTVAQALTANTLLAIGAVPTMTGSPEEVADFVAGSAALYVNLGTMDDARRQGIDAGVAAAQSSGVPWVLDPAHCEASLARTRYAKALLAERPVLIRMNARESEALYETSDPSRLPPTANLVHAITGPVDRIRGDSETIALANGHPLQARVTAMGCAATAVIAAFLAVGLPATLAAAAGLTAVNVAAEQAAAMSSGPGTFAMQWLDALYRLDADTLARAIRLNERETV